MSDLNIHQRMLKVMEDVERVQKDSFNPQGKFKYASHNAVTSAIRPLLVKHGISLQVSVVDHEVFEMPMRNYTAQGVRGTVQVEYINVDKPEQRVTSLIPAADVIKEGKGFGSLLSYGVKYSFNKNFAMLADDDEDVDASTGPSENAKRDYNFSGNTSAASEGQVNLINKLAADKNMIGDLKRYAKEKGISRDTMTKEQAQVLIDWLKDGKKPEDDDIPWND